LFSEVLAGGLGVGFLKTKYKTPATTARVKIVFVVLFIVF